MQAGKIIVAWTAFRQYTVGISWKLIKHSGEEFELSAFYDSGEIFRQGFIRRLVHKRAIMHAVLWRGSPPPVKTSHLL
jgi:hypothetical protein